MKTILLSDVDINVLMIFLDNCNPCRCGCVYPKMQGKYPEGCSECQFTKDTWEVKKKIKKAYKPGNWDLHKVLNNAPTIIEADKAESEVE